MPPLPLEKGIGGYIGKTTTGYECMFNSDKMQYNVKLQSENGRYEPSKNELITIVNSMITSKESWSKYPDNSDMKFIDADLFYQSLDKQQYVEFNNAKLNIREKTYYKDVNKVLSQADGYGKSRVGGDGTHPNRQMYVFVTVAQDGSMRMAVFDAETGRKRFGGGN